MSFAQVENATPVPGNDGRTHATTECYNCHNVGHFASNCPDSDTRRSETSSLVQLALSFTQQFGDVIKRSWVLLDTCSTVCVGNNESFITNLRPCKTDERIRVQTNLATKILIASANSKCSHWTSILMQHPWQTSYLSRL
jgi:hypothetical protein